jgi:hypothetical protein
MWLCGGTLGLHSGENTRGWAVLLSDDNSAGTTKLNKTCVHCVVMDHALSIGAIITTIRSLTGELVGEKIDFRSPYVYHRWTLRVLFANEMRV